MKTIVAAIFATFLFCSTASAQRQSERFPDSVVIQINGERHEAFNMGNFVELLRIDKDLQDAIEEIAVLESEIESFRLHITSLDAALNLSEENLRLVTDDRTRLTELYRTTNLRLREVENKPNFLGITGWVTSTVALGVIGGLVAAIKLDQ